MMMTITKKEHVRRANLPCDACGHPVRWSMDAAPIVWEYPRDEYDDWRREWGLRSSAGGQWCWHCYRGGSALAVGRLVNGQGSCVMPDGGLCKKKHGSRHVGDCSRDYWIRFYGRRFSR